MLKVLVPVDGSNHSKRALREAIKIASLTDTNLLMLHVRNEYITQVGKTSVDHRLYGKEESEKRSKALLENMAKELSEIEKDKIKKISQVANVAKLSKIGDVAETITNFVDKEKIDFVVMGSQGVNAGKIQSVFIGSVTREVLAHASCPVLVVK